MKFDLADGLDVICHGHVDVYAPRGSYQLVIDELQPKGVGALELALRKLREKLAAEGLFDPARKRKLPAFPRRVAFVTSPTGAAIHDFLQVLRRRWRGVDVLVIPARVQGEGARRKLWPAFGWRIGFRRGRMCWSSVAAAAAWKICGRSTKSRSCGRSRRRRFRQCRPWGTRSM